MTLKDRIAHHFTTGLSTVEVSSQNAQKLNEEFRKFHQNKAFKYKSYVLRGDKDKLDALKSLLEKHNIAYGDLESGSYKGHSYSSGNTGSLTINKNGMVVSTDQPKGTLVKVLFEPNAKLSDSLTYDITAWSLPYAYGLDAIASTSAVSPQSVQQSMASFNINSGSYAYLADWNSMEDARFLAALLKEGIRVRKADHPFGIEGKSFDRGTLIITKGDNENKEDFITTLQSVAQRFNKDLTATSTGFVDSGKDFGSSSIQMITKPKIAVLSGGPTSTLRFGEIWHFFEQQLHYPLTVIDDEYADRVDLDEYHILILPDGRYGNYFNEDKLSELKSWVRQGGKIIAMGGSINALDGENGFGIKQKKMERDTSENSPQPYEDWERERIKGAITGAIFKTKVDNSNPLAYGYGADYFTLKLGSSAFEYLDNGNAVYLEQNTKPFSGFAGIEAQKRISETLIYGVENYGRGQVIYMVDNPLFRGFWENGKLFFANALFMVD